MDPIRGSELSTGHTTKTCLTLKRKWDVGEKMTVQKISKQVCKPQGSESMSVCLFVTV